MSFARRLVSDVASALGFRALAGPAVRGNPRANLGEGSLGGGQTVIPSLPRRVPTNEFEDLIVTHAEAWDAYGARMALSDHDNGQFMLSAQLCDSMLRDDRIMACLNTRVQGLQGLPFAITPKDETPEAKAVSDALAEDWEWILPARVFEELVQWEAMMGFCLCEIVWDTSGPRWIPTLKVWHPQFIYYRAEIRRYVVIAREGTILITPGDAKWFLFSRHDHARSWIHGAVRALAIPYLARQYSLRDWGRYNEVHGLPIRQANVPMSASHTDKQRFFQQIRELGSTGALLSPEGSDGRKFSLSLIEAANHQSWQAFERLLLRGDAAINLVLLGQNMSGGEISGGSFAAAKVADGVRDDFKLGDATSLSADVRWQIVRPYVRFNFGDDAPMPLVGWDATPREDQAQAATTLKTVAEAMGLFVGMGATVDLPAIVKRFSLPVAPDSVLKAAAPTVPKGFA